MINSLIHKLCTPRHHPVREGERMAVRSPRSLMRVPVCKRAGCPQPRGRGGCTLGKRPFLAQP